MTSTESPDSSGSVAAGGVSGTSAGTAGATPALDAAIDVGSEASPAPVDAGRDAAVVVGNQQILMVGLTSGKPSPGDTLMIGHLETRGFKVTLVADTVVTAAMTAGKDLVLISSSEESGNLMTKLRDVAVPIVCMEDGSLPDMKMVGMRNHTNGQSTVKMVGTHPLTDGLSGTITIANNPPDPADLGWGLVGPKAIVAATTVADATQAVLFGYQTGDDMVGMVAPARRVGFCAREAIASHFSPDGFKILDSAIDWALGLK